MKRTLLILYMLVFSVLLTGCEGDLFASRRDMERLRPIQTLGIDLGEDGYIISVSTGIGPNEYPPLVMSDFGPSIEDTITTLQNDSPQDELFYAHVQYILLGESLTQSGILPVLDWVERSPTMRLGTPIFAVRGSAADAVTASGENTDITMLLASLEREQQTRGEPIYTLREVATDLYERGNTLFLSVVLKSSEETVPVGTDASLSVIPAGYAVLRDGVVISYLTEEESKGAVIAHQAGNGMKITAGGHTMSLLSSKTDFSGEWDGGTLTGILIDCELETGILERSPGAETDITQLQSELSDTVTGWLKAVAERSQALSCDFLCMETSVLKNAPNESDELTWDEIFPTLPITVQVKTHIDKSYDISG
ncbi:MAG: Ger(x)C family spore germination C-terminal domain-containing protein [Oscillospiraceae bacterium]